MSLQQTPAAQIEQIEAGYAPGTARQLAEAVEGHKESRSS
jgi:hypothetical protein